MNVLTNDLVIKPPIRIVHLGLRADLSGTIERVD